MTGRIEVLPGPERRRRWSFEEKSSIVAEAFSPGAIVTHVARRRDVRPQQIYQWRRELASSSAPDPRLLPVELLTADESRSLQTSAAAERIEIVLSNGRRLLAPPSISSVVLKRLIAAVEAA